MASQLDLDQGGTFRQTRKVYMGPSVGWVAAPDQTVLDVISGGTTTLLRGMNLVLANFNGSVSIQLPPAKTFANPQAIPYQHVIIPVVILDKGGFASAINPIQILCDASELGPGIDGLPSIEITSAYGAYVLRPNIITGGWTLLQ